MLPLNVIDLSTLVMARENHYLDGDTFFWIDPATGAIALWGEEAADEAEAEGWDMKDRGGIRIAAVDSDADRTDMENFLNGVGESPCKDRLRAALDHTSPSRHFKDALYAFPEQQTAWYEFHNALLKQRAISWLSEAGVVEPEEADAAISQLRNFS